MINQSRAFTFHGIGVFYNIILNPPQLRFNGIDTLHTSALGDSASLFPTSARAPVEPKERLITLDVLRGFAIFGILLVHILSLSQQLYPTRLSLASWPLFPDRLVVFLVALFATGKVSFLFSFLFGLGFALHLERAHSLAAGLVLYRRRLLVLFVIGLVHAFLSLAGDILAIYAVLGFALPRLRISRDKTLIRAATVCLFVPVLLTLGWYLFLALDLPSFKDARVFARYTPLSGDAIRFYSQSTLAPVLARKIKDVPLMYFRLSPAVPAFFGMFLIGFYLGRQRTIQTASAHIPFIRKLMWWSLAVGSIANLAAIGAGEYSSVTSPSPAGVARALFLALGRPALCLFYVFGVVLLLENAIWRKRLAGLAGVGRTTLSNYLVQSMLCTTIAYGYGLRWYGRLTPASGVLLATVIFLVQILLSQFWLVLFRFGPIEWLWRSLTYWKRQPMFIGVTGGRSPAPPGARTLTAWRGQN